MQQFEIITQKPFAGKYSIEYGLLRGNGTVFMIKAGKDGSIYGYQNKYLHLAHAIRAKYGYTVLCASNPYQFADSIAQAKEVIQEHAHKHFSMVYLGVSAGGTMGASYVCHHPEIVKMLLINIPLRINLMKVLKNMEGYQGECAFVFGSLDPSMPYVKLLEKVTNDRISIEIIENADHNLSQHTEQYQLLSEKYLCSI